MMDIAERVACVLPSPPRAIFDLAAQYADVIDLTPLAGMAKLKTLSLTR